MNNVCTVAKLLKHKVIIGGWVITKKTLTNRAMRNAWGFDILSDKVTCYSIGNNVDIVDKICKRESFSHEIIGNSVVAYSAPITDFSDQTSTPLVTDIIEQNESLVTELAAGCVFSCSFCNYGLLGKKKYEYMRSYESLKTEFVTNYNNFGTTVYLLSDNIVNDNDEKLKNLIRIREETGIDIRWVGYVRLDTIKNSAQAQLIAESGIAGCVMGIESFKPEVGRYIGKVTDRDRLIPQLEMFRKAVGDNCLTFGSFIAGLPTETKRDLWHTYEWLQTTHGKDLLDDYMFAALGIYEDNDEKNDINKNRNHPFRDYNIITPANWTSPWGSYNEFAELSNYFNQACISKIGGFTPAMLHNADYKLEDILQMGRDKNITMPYTNLIQTKVLIQRYKTRLLDSVLR